MDIVTPTTRVLGLPLVNRGLQRQTVNYEKWLIGSFFDPLLGEWVKDGFTGGFWTLNRCMNELIRKSSAELIISVQDYTFINPEALEKFDFYFKKNPLSIVSGVGDKYESVEPLGARVWKDPRRNAATQFGTCPFHFIEGNFCAIPRQAFFDVGGFDESLDFVGFGLDFYSLLDRLDIQGKYKFYLDPTNESFSLPHDRVENWDEDNISASTYIQIHNGYLENPVLKYLA